MSHIVDSLSEDYAAGYHSSILGHGQSFTGDGSSLQSAKFYLSKNGLPIGNIYSKVYAHTGTFGVSSLPTGPALAISDAVDVSTLTTSPQLISFNFSGENKISLENGTNYVVAVIFNGGDDVNRCNYFASDSYLDHNGNLVILDEEWSAAPGFDACFYVYGDEGSGTTVNASSTDSVNYEDSLTHTLSNYLFTTATDSIIATDLKKQQYNQHFIYDDTKAYNYGTETRLSRVVDYSRLPVDQISVADYSQIQSVVFISVLDQALMEESLSKSKSILRSESDQISFADFIKVTTNQIFSALISDSVSLDDSLAKEASYIREELDQIDLLDYNALYTVLLIHLVDQYQARDSISHASSFSRPRAETISLSDLLYYDASFILSVMVSDVVSVADSLSRTSDTFIRTRDLIEIADNISKSVELRATVADLIELGDSLTKQSALEIILKIVDAVGITDETSRDFIANRVLEDGTLVEDVNSYLQTNSNQDVGPSAVLIDKAPIGMIELVSSRAKVLDYVPEFTFIQKAKDMAKVGKIYDSHTFYNKHIPYYNALSTDLGPSVKSVSEV